MAAFAVVGLTAAPASAATPLTINGSPTQFQVGTSYGLVYDLGAADAAGIPFNVSSGPTLSASGSSSGPGQFYFYNNGQCIGDDLPAGGKGNTD
ncbi:hypothetical protein [Nocardia tengchongensis]|uniref:hypothetical protein n=1 Tax=Nocardia tengchongensis TaxID=2055889 RepID=UPI0036C7146A